MVPDDCIQFSAAAGPGGTLLEYGQLARQDMVDVEAMPIAQLIVREARPLAAERHGDALVDARPSVQALRLRARERRLEHGHLGLGPDRPRTALQDVPQAGQIVEHLAPQEPPHGRHGRVALLVAAAGTSCHDDPRPLGRLRLPGNPTRRVPHRCATPRRTRVDLTCIIADGMIRRNGRADDRVPSMPSAAAAAVAVIGAGWEPCRILGFISRGAGSVEISCNMGKPVAALTVGIPFHAGVDPAHFRQALDSVLAQSCPAAEMHVIQDGPVSAQLIDVVREFETRSGNLKWLILPRNCGLPTALNVSILACQTRYYARMDADDICHPERFSRQVSFLEDHPEIDIVGTWALEFRERCDSEDSFLKKMPLTQDEISRFFHFRDPFVHSSVVFRHSTFVTLGLYDTRFLTDQDTELWARALRHRTGMANLSEALLYFRVGTMIEKRSGHGRILRQIRARYAFRTFSPVLNALKLGSIVFRFLPVWVRRICYSKLR